MKVSLRTVAQGIGPSISELFRIAGELNALSTVAGDEIEIDTSPVRFLHPGQVLGLSTLKRLYPMSRVTANHTAYLNTVAFPQGLSDIEDLPAFDDRLKICQDKTYIPVLRLSRSNDFSGLDIARHAINNIIQNNAPKPLCNNTLVYLIQEAFDNILQHSQAQDALFFAQVYPQKRYLEIWLSDIGIGLFGAYKAAKFDEVTTHKEAITKALLRQSCKDMEGRGFGIWTANRILAGLGGHYLIRSGNVAGYFDVNKNEPIIYQWPEEQQYGGTMVAMKLPLEAPVGYRYQTYIE